MIDFPGSKINIGLNVLGKRPDGYHDIESVFYPLDWSDIVEVIPGEKGVEFHASGLKIEGAEADNLCLRALQLLTGEDPVSCKIYLHKLVPMGAGLGGGSADGSAILRLANEVLELGYEENELLQMAEKLGSDCPFFLLKEPAYVTGRGERVERIPIDLKDYKIAVIHPGIHVSTAEAYVLAQKGTPDYDLRQTVTEHPSTWKDKVKNGFEQPLVSKFPEIGEIKEQFYTAGALYSSMTGSGSAVYAIFEDAVPSMEWPDNYMTWKEL